MMKYRKGEFAYVLVACLFLGLVIFPLYSVEASEKTLPSGLPYGDLPDAVERYVKEHEETTCGMNVIVYDRDGTIYERAFGYMDKESSLQSDLNTVYEWGSISKLLIWVSVMQLYEAGKIDLYADIRVYLPEGFLKNLSFDEPITMLDLMNHQAGFEDMYFIQTADLGEMKSLEEVLRTRQPKQVYRPGEHTAYSNWGAALAAYIVERVSGMDYAAYVHKNIFEPLHMEHTSISADYSDNQWVYDKRLTLKCYNTAGEKIEGPGLYYIFFYPAGSAMGTISDLATFARALTPDKNNPSPLFKNPKTLEKMLTPTSFYGSTTVPKNKHGFFASQYGIETVGHGGNTFGCSSMLQFDPASGIGMVVMTNQAHENIFNYDMYEIVFGKFTDSEPAKKKRELPKGLVLNTRGIMNGPLSFVGALSVMRYSEEDLDQWWYVENGLVETPFSDFFISTPKALTNILCMVFFAIAGLYGLLRLVIGRLILDPIRKKKGTFSTGPLRKDGDLLSGSMALTLMNLVFFFLRLLEGFRTGDIGSPASYQIRSALFGILAILMVAVMWKAREHYGAVATKKEKREFTMMSLLAIVQCLVIASFELYQFWAI